MEVSTYLCKPMILPITKILKEEIYSLRVPDTENGNNHSNHHYNLPLSLCMACMSMLPSVINIHATDEPNKFCTCKLLEH